MLFALEAISSLPGASDTAVSVAALGEVLRADLQARENPDAALLGRIVAGDRDAFRVLVERHADKAFGLCFRILRNRAVAEAVVRETLLEVWTNGVGGAGDRLKFPMWLCRAIVTRCADAVSELAAGTRAGAPEGEAAHPLDRATDCLPELQRLAIILSCHEGLPNEDIASVLATSNTAVEMLLKQARRSLREALAAGGA